MKTANGDLVVESSGGKLLVAERDPTRTEASHAIERRMEELQRLGVEASEALRKALEDLPDAAGCCTRHCGVGRDSRRTTAAPSSSDTAQGRPHA